jgi:hypothetical protein
MKRLDRCFRWNERRGVEVVEAEVVFEWMKRRTLVDSAYASSSLSENVDSRFQLTKQAKVVQVIQLPIEIQSSQLMQTVSYQVAASILHSILSTYPSKPLSNSNQISNFPNWLVPM